MEDSFAGTSWITGAKYNTETKQMQVYIGTKGEVYEFEGVDSGTWSEFKSAKSRGKYFNNHIRGNFTSPNI